ncbi:MAG: tryptophan--tRNA ligase [Candidatus Paceibacterota bacterium]
MPDSTQKVLVSGVKPTARPHIGNYLGAMKQFVDMQHEYDTRVFIADYHALTTLHDADTLREMTYNIALDYLAIGLDPETTHIYKQSDVPSHTELAVILSNTVPSSYLTRAHAYKAAQDKNEDINAGTLYYPILMAADILMYDTHIVPVGADQKQHVEYARDIAERFNHTYGETFVIPQARILENVQTVPGVDSRKMSKSYGNDIGLFATDDEITKAVMSIPTDSQDKDAPKKEYTTDTLYQLHTHFTTGNELEKVKTGYKEGGLGYKESKEILIESIKGLIAPLRDKREEIANDRDFVMSVLDTGARAARAEASEKMNDVRAKVGLTASQ